MQIVLTIHSIVRWLIVALGAAGLIKFLGGWLRGGAFEGMDRGLAAGFSGLIDLQVTLGLIYLIWNGLATETGFPLYRIEHMLIMLLAAFAAHLPARMKAFAAPARFRNAFFGVAAALLLIVLGVASLPGGWTR